MSWIDDWAEAIYNVCIKRTVDALGTIVFPVWMVKIAAEDELQRERIKAIKDKKFYPPDPTKHLELLSSRADLSAAMGKLLKLLGFQDSAAHIYFEATRYKPRIAEAAALWQRGIISQERLDTHLTELGMQNDVSTPTGPPDRYGLASWEVKQRPDRTNFHKLLWRIPDIPDVIHMELRDAFPMSVERVREMTGDIPELEQWARTQPFSYAVDDWTVGGGVDLLDSLKQESTYGPQSFASWYMGARKWYTPIFEKVASSLGVDPYFAMKHWEAHWRLPSWRMGRRLLWRTKYVTEDMWAQILRWNDYPPNLIEPMVQASYQALTITDTRRMHMIGVMTLPDVFISYLDFGYRPADAARMTAFVALDNMESLWRDVINETLKAVSDGALATVAACDYIWQTVYVEFPTELPPEIIARLSADNIDRVMQMFQRVQQMKIAWIQKVVVIAVRKGEIASARKQVAVAKRNYTGWVWTRAETESRLVALNLTADAISALLTDWEPEREGHERLPTQHMLEELLARQELSVTQFRQIMHDKKYSEATIDLILAQQEKLPTRAMLEDFWLDKRIDNAEFIERMQQLGYAADIAALALSALKRLPSQSMLEEFLIAGRITNAEFIDGMERLGFTTETAQDALAALARPPTQAMLQSSWIAGRIGDTEFIDGMLRLGFTRTAALHALDALEQPPTQSMLQSFWQEQLITDAEFITGMMNLGFSRETAEKALVVLQQA